MKKITRRASALLLIALLIIAGTGFYCYRYVTRGEEWALYFSSLNSGSTGTIVDRNGSLLATLSATECNYSPVLSTRLACYHVTGDYWNRSGTGVLTAFRSGLQNYSVVRGTTQAESSNMSLTIDAGLSTAAYEALAGRNGAVMVMNYRTGEILAMVSTPSVDPADPSGNVAEGAYINRCLSATYTPGSIFKLVTAAAAIENLSNLDGRSFFCEGEYEIAGVTITCSGSHWTQNFEQALANSCNVAFAQIAVKLGQNTLTKYVRSYGFLDRLKIESISTAAGSYPLEFVGDPELAWSGIGQSTDLISPYSMLRYVCAIANDGIITEGYLRSDAERLSSRLMEGSTAQRLQQLMRNNVVEHYEGDTNFPGLPLCAKTGTAELGDGTTHAWFTGFLQDEQHPYAFIVLVERGGGGLSVAGPVANTVLQYAVKNS